MELLNFYVQTLGEFQGITMDSPFGVFLRYVYLFIIGSFIGWIGEALFRRFVSMKRWINPGFLKGPCLPLYGFGLCTLNLISELCFKYLTLEGTYPPMYGLVYGEDLATLGTLNFWYVSIIAILIIGVALTLVELIAGLFFVKGLNIKLWDYSKLKGNFMGIICPLFSFLWLVAGALYRFLLRPFVLYAITFLNHHAWGLTFLLGAYLALLFVDFITSLKLSLKLSKTGRVEKAVIDWEEFKLNLKEKTFKEKKENALLEEVKKSLKPLQTKIKKASNTIKAHMYIDNKIPEVTNEAETPRMKDERLKKEEQEKENDN